MRTYLPSLEELITTCNNQLEAGLTEQKRDYILTSIKKLELMKSIIQGNPFNVPENATKYDVLVKIEKQLQALIAQFNNQKLSAGRC